MIDEKTVRAVADAIKAADPSRDEGWDYSGEARAAITAYLSAKSAEPVAWMRRWAYDGVDVMAIRKPDRPRGWACYATTQDKLFDNDVPLYAHPKEAPDV